MLWMSAACSPLPTCMYTYIVQWYTGVVYIFIHTHKYLTQCSFKPGIMYNFAQSQLSISNRNRHKDIRKHICHPRQHAKVPLPLRPNSKQRLDTGIDSSFDSSTSSHQGLVQTGTKHGWIKHFSIVVPLKHRSSMVLPILGVGCFCILWQS